MGVVRRECEDAGACLAEGADGGEHAGEGGVVGIGIEDGGAGGEDDVIGQSEVAGAATEGGGVARARIEGDRAA